MPGTVVSTLCSLTFSLLRTLCDGFIISLLQMSHRAEKRQAWDSNPGSLASDFLPSSLGGKMKIMEHKCWLTGVGKMEIMEQSHARNLESGGRV